MRAFHIRSDDDGKTWQRGDIAIRNAGEPNITELPDGRVLVTARNTDPRNRRVAAFSPDGATGWSKPEFLEEEFAWLRDYGPDLEQWSEFQSLTQMAIEVVRSEGYCSTATDLRAGFPCPPDSYEGRLNPFECKPDAAFASNSVPQCQLSHCQANGHRKIFQDVQYDRFPRRVGRRTWYYLVLIEHDEVLPVLFGRVTRLPGLIHLLGLAPERSRHSGRARNRCGARFD